MSRSEYEVLLLDARAGYAVYTEKDSSFWVGFGYSSLKLEHDISDLSRVYVSQVYPGAAGNVFGDYRTYEAKYKMPYLAAWFDMKYKKSFTGSIGVGWSPVVRTDSEDHFINYDTLYEAEGKGNAYMIGIRGDYHFARFFTVGMSFNYTKINTRGEEEQYDSYALTRTIDYRDYTEVMRTLINIGIAF